MMILKNCYIYDESAEKEISADFYFDDKIIDYGAGLADSLKNIEFSETDIFSLDAYTIEKINSGSGKIIVDMKGLVTLPGGIDAHVHFDTPGFTEREDFFHGSMSAAAGGITTVIDMPCTSLPPVTNRENFDIKYDAVKDSSVIDFGFFGGVDSRKFKEFEECMIQLAEKKVKGFKTYFISGMSTYPRVTKYEFSHVLEYAVKLNLPVLLHAEDYATISNLEKKHAGLEDNYIKYCKTRPAEAEINAVKEALFVAGYVNDNLHIVHVGSAEAAALINKPGPESRITYETCPHYLAFTQDDFERKGTSLKTAPVVKTARDREKLWRYLIEGQCGFAASDHAPCSVAEKNTGSFSSDYGGIPGTQTLLPYIFSEGYIKRGMPLKRLCEVISTAPAKRYGLYPGKGSLKKNSDADFTFVDKQRTYSFSKEELLSKGETTPFDGEEFTGKVVMTILRGKIIYYEKNGIVIKKGYGRYI